MALLTPLWMQPAEGDASIPYSANDDRWLITSLWDTEGVIWGLTVSQRAAGANFSVDVAPGQAIITGNDVSGQGSYLVTSTDVVNVPVPAPPASGSRTHRVVAWVRDKLHDGTQSTYDWTLTVLEDTGGGTPAQPPSAITLALVTVAAGQTSVTDADITPGAINALMRPSRLRQVASASARPAIPLAAEMWLRTDLRAIEVFDGTSVGTVPILSAPVEAESNTDVTTTSTTFVAGSPQVGVSFKAPPSGRVFVTVYAQLECESPSAAYCGFEIRLNDATGTVVVAASQDVAAAAQDAFFAGSTRRKLITGLTPVTQTYFARTMHRTSNSASTATIFHRAILVEPAP